MLINKYLAGKKTGTEYGVIAFNDKGENNDLTAEQQKKLGALPGFEYKEDKKPEPKKAPVQKEKPKAPEVKKDEEK